MTTLTMNGFTLTIGKPDPLFKKFDYVTLKRKDMPEYKGTITKVIYNPINGQYLYIIKVELEFMAKQLNNSRVQFYEQHLRLVKNGK